jgi:hypothetical protein
MDDARNLRSLMPLTGASTRNAVPLIFLATVLAGCIRYRPAPIAPQQVQAEFMARSFSETGLRKYLEERAPAKSSQWPATQDLSSLTLTAFYYNPELEIARARELVALEEERLRAAMASMMHQRLAAGDISRPDAENFRVAAEDARMALRAADERLAAVWWRTRASRLFCGHLRRAPSPRRPDAPGRESANSFEKGKSCS